MTSSSILACSLGARKVHGDTLTMYGIASFNQCTSTSPICVQIPVLSKSMRFHFSVPTLGTSRLLNRRSRPHGESSASHAIPQVYSVLSVLVLQLRKSNQRSVFILQWISTRLERSSRLSDQLLSPNQAIFVDSGRKSLLY